MAGVPAGLHRGGEGGAGDGRTIAVQTAAGEAAMLVLLNAGDEPFRFPLDVAGLTVAETPDPGARPDDPVLVPAHSWVILGT